MLHFARHPGNHGASGPRGTADVPVRTRCLCHSLGGHLSPLEVVSFLVEMGGLHCLTKSVGGWSDVCEVYGQEDVVCCLTNMVSRRNDNKPRYVSREILGARKRERGGGGHSPSVSPDLFLLRLGPLLHSASPSERHSVCLSQSLIMSCPALRPKCVCVCVIRNFRKLSFHFKSTHTL